MIHFLQMVCFITMKHHPFGRSSFVRFYFFPKDQAVANQLVSLREMFLSVFIGYRKT